jgi:hypothetical protein
MEQIADLLKSIDRRLSTKTENNSFAFTISWDSIYEQNKNTAYYTQTFLTPILLDSLEYEIAVISLETFYSFPNITENVNNVFAYKDDPAAESKIVLFPTGSYEISNLAHELKRQVGDDVYTSMSLEKNISTLKTVFKLKPNYRIDFTQPNSIRSILGFDSRIVGGTNDKYYSGDHVVNILTVNTVLVNCDLINNSYNNGVLAPIIYSFFPNVAPGFKIVRNVENPVYLPVNKTQINNITVWLTDQNNNPLNFRGETITIRFHLRRIK